MNCPICNSELLAHQKDLLICPKGHGTLITGKLLSNKDDSLIYSESNNTNTKNTNHNITCPNCSKEMHKVDYSSSGVVIDSCINCHFRWLDSGEINKIKNFKPNLSPVDLELIKDLYKLINEADSYKVEEANPSIPYSMLNNNKLGSQFNIFLMFKTIVIGLFHSKTSRILTIITIIILTLLILFIFFDYQDTIQSFLN